MLKLENVSKFYYSKGVITSGITKVNLQLDRGEFVVITGESGSGKSTLLNVISGLDSYEEGEMYVNGEETGHYTEADFESYRRRYIGNIFQNFNLIGSYTAAQNVELAMRLNGAAQKEAKRKTLEILDRVGMKAFAHTKCSKLSGGQKQRVAIARALAKDTPIIVADEPTGNLDSASAADVIGLLSEVAKDKLVIIVTHSPEQVEPYATRIIKMHDGRVLEDRRLTPAREEAEKPVSAGSAAKNLSAGGVLRLGLRNAFNIPAKFVLIFAVFLLIGATLGGTYAAFQKEAYEASVSGWNWMFPNRSDDRIVIKKTDGTPISDGDFAALNAMNNVKKIDTDDLLVDYIADFYSEDYGFWFNCTVNPIDSFEGKLSAGRMPESPDEVILVTDPGSYVADEIDSVIDREMMREVARGKRGDKIRIVGVAIDGELDGRTDMIFGGEKLLEETRRDAIERYNTVTVSFGDGNMTGAPIPGILTDDVDVPTVSGAPIVPLDTVPAGGAYVSGNMSDRFEDGKCVGKELRLAIENPYFTDKLSLKITAGYTRTDFEKLTGIPYSAELEDVIYVNSGDWKRFTEKGIFQSSVYVEDTQLIDETVNELKAAGYTPLALRDARATDGAGAGELLTLVEGFVLILLVAALFFVAYFIIRIVLRSRNGCYTTLRTLGASRRVARNLLITELAAVSAISFFILLILVGPIKTGAVSFGYISDAIRYLHPVHFAVIFAVLIAMAVLIAFRYCRKLFKDSVMRRYREGA